MSPVDCPGGILIIGGNGGLGSAILRRGTMADGRRLVGVARSPAPRVSLLADVTDERRVREVVRHSRPAAVVNLAGINGRLCDDYRAVAQTVNVTAPGWMLDELKDQGRECVMIQPSTSAVYGDAYDGLVSESGPINLGSTYAEMKYRAEQSLIEAATDRVRVVIMRIFNVYGAEFHGSLVQRLVTSSPDAPVTLTGLDSFSRDYVHVDDVIDAIDLSVSTPLTGPTATFNIGSGVSTTNRDLVLALGRRHSIFWDEIPAARSHTGADIQSARRWLGFNPARSLRDHG